MIVTKPHFDSDEREKSLQFCMYVNLDPIFEQKYVFFFNFDEV